MRAVVILDTEVPTCDCKSGHQFEFQRQINDLNIFLINACFIV